MNPAGCLGYCMLPWAWRLLPFLEETEVWQSVIKFEKSHRTDADGSFFIGWHHRKFFLVPSEERRCLYVTARASWKQYEAFRALSVPSGTVFAYKVNAMIEDEEGRAGAKQDVFPRVAVADRCEMVIMQFLERAWPW